MVSDEESDQGLKMDHRAEDGFWGAGGIFVSPKRTGCFHGLTKIPSVESQSFIDLLDLYRYAVFNTAYLASVSLELKIST